jgi:hypothetical protein
MNAKEGSWLTLISTERDSQLVRHLVHRIGAV